ncbi:diaminohydroxyphosphoribosylaminopyrimidine deaminase/5-amino-6-(5-phosphoribosylamino)uracil reductase [Haloferula luteola]|uniref:Riboflavin biosynthesis protein RibD n=1 Tax=Haloferula luteola TaxID=595692 RepID=A0A840VBU1_9BACT|nr:bifunctional diaminohydroxyphosphoribosylaminopyrimidine deaminase/5-amino-6-(5-phosphoribosylamino)uracil reductase RibD [Haloferula luteola]MBB5351400.1 diaminohydroxyphosphoribosylaminopyrimidine deaminase/5-amino-6-(5-phosphoribosylamino)uracil reductase [Haloferula luteola]
MEADEHWMRRALEEAQKGMGRTAPNPPVGAVIVKDGEELGAGWHRRAGLPHAEREALADARRRGNEEKLRGATIYVTLEPCSTQGRTPPCVDGILEAGLRRVVYAAMDPNPRHAGRANRVLGAAGVEVTSGVMEEEAKRWIRPFRKAMLTGLPWVIWKTAMSLDARLTRPPGEGMWLTGPESRQKVQALRAEVQAIVTSGATVRADRPRLDLRDPSYLEGRETPWRVVATEDPLSLPADAPLFTDAWRDRTLVVPRGNPEKMLRDLVEERGVHSVLLECGGRMAGSWMDAGLIDEVVAFMAPMLTGGAVPPLEGKGFDEGCALDEVVFERFGSDVMMRARVAKRGEAGK